MSSLSLSFAHWFWASLCPQSPGTVVQLSIWEREAIVSTCGCFTNSTRFLSEVVWTVLIIRYAV